jgi:hypothetical protein
MTLSPKRIEAMARELAACNDQRVTEAIKQYDPETKIAIRQAVSMQREAQGIHLDGAAEVPGRHLGEQDGSYWLRRLNVEGPIDLKTLEAKMTAAGLQPGVRLEIKCEAIERGWLPKMLGYRVNAAGELATDQDGRPIGRLATDEARFDYGREPLSVEMAGLFRRASLREDDNYSQAEVNNLLQASDLTTMQRMAVRQELATRRQVSAAGADLESHTARMTALFARLKALRV